jgi:hypothetical protein
MNFTHMPTYAALISKWRWTPRTLVRRRAGVNYHVILQGVRLCKGLRTFRTFEWFLTSVYSHVISKNTFNYKQLGTFRTAKRLLASMCSHMESQTASVSKWSRTNRHFSPVCIHIWLCKIFDCANGLEQSVQLKDFSLLPVPVCLIIPYGFLGCYCF